MTRPGKSKSRVVFVIELNIGPLIVSSFGTQAQLATTTPTPVIDDLDGGGSGLQSVAALRQAARDVFWASSSSASPRNSPLPAHRNNLSGTNLNGYVQDRI